MASGGDCAGNGADVRHLKIETKQAGTRGRADARRPHGKARLYGIGWAALAGLILAACSTSAPPGQNGKEYFSQKVYGKASPRRVALEMSLSGADSWSQRSLLSSSSILST